MDTDRNLLFGVLALQADLLTPARFAEACSAWAARKTDPLADLLVERGWLTPADRADVDRLLERKLKKHGGDVRASLAEVMSVAGTSDPAVRESVHALDPTAGAGFVSTGDYRPETRDRYTLSRLHATGGLGRVWLARDVPLNRDVALKDLRPERAGHPAVRGRFLKEAQITGQLEHPGIVPVYELGRRPTDDTPFYTMRFVRGRTLAEAARAFHQRRRQGEAGPLDFRQLVTAFVGVCQAVAYAHSKGVVHRDLKPQNVALGDYGEVMVLDWGLAKLIGRPDAAADLPLSAEPDESASATVQGQVLGTPAYMAPEQAEGRLDLIDHRTDVYGLGAILYELLAGRAPFTGEDTQDVLARVRTLDPDPPRQTWAAVPRALEAVCRKALAKRPEARYPTATELATDVQHWLADEPVAAYREPVLARAARWGRRHRSLATGAAAVLVVTVAALAAGTVLLQRASAATARERDEARRQRDRADASDRRARRAVDDFYTRFSGRLADAPGLQPVRRELLQAALRYYQEFAADRADDPAVRAELALAHWRAGAILGEIDTPAAAAAEYRKGLAIQEDLVRDHPDEPEYRNDLSASCNNLGLVLAGLGEKEAGLALVRRGLDLREELARQIPEQRSYVRNLASGYNNLATLADAGPERGGPEAKAALRWHEKALEVRRKLSADDPTDLELRDEVGATLNNLGAWHYTHGTPAEAVRYYEQARELREQVRAKLDTPARRHELAKTWFNLGLLYRMTDQPDKALPALTEAAKLIEPLARDNPKVTAYRHLLAETSNGTGIVHAEAGRTAPALAAFERAAGLREGIARDNPAVRPYREELARSQLNLGAMYQKADRLADARPRLERACEVYQELSGEVPDDRTSRAALGLACNNLGAVQADLGEPEKALATYDRAVAEYDRLLKADPDNPSYHSRLAAVWDNRGVALGKLDRWPAALDAYRRAVAEEQAALARRPGDRRYQAQLADHHDGVGLACRKLNRPADAVAALAEVGRLRAGDPLGLYNAACGLALCVPLVEAGKAERREYADRAMTLLKAAVAAGYRDVGHLKKDRDLDPLRDRPDFRQLLDSLAGPPVERGPAPRPVKP